MKGKSTNIAKVSMPSGNVSKPANVHVAHGAAVPAGYAANMAAVARTASKMAHVRPGKGWSR